MNTKNKKARAVLAAGTLTLICGAASAQAEMQARIAVDQAGATATAVAPASKDEATAAKHVNDAVTVVQKMQEEARMKELLAQAKGIFIVPTYGRAALGVGAEGGAGVLLIRKADGAWSDPAFYNIGGLSAGAQVGVEAGAIALVLNNEKAVNKFMQKNKFAVNAAAGLTIVNWSKIAQGSLGDGDVVAWSGAKGLYGSLVSVGVNDIRYNQKLTDAYYHQMVPVTDAVAGKYTVPASDALKQALAAAPAMPAK